MDHDHKLAKFIITHPPESSGLGVVSAAGVGASSAEVGVKEGKNDRATRKILKAQQQAELARQKKDSEGSESAEAEIESSQKDQDAKAPVNNNGEKERKENKGKKDKKDRAGRESLRECLDARTRADNRGDKERKDKKSNKDKKDICERMDSKHGKQSKIRVVSDTAQNLPDTPAENTGEALSYFEKESRQLIKSLQIFLPSRSGPGCTDDFFDEVRLHQISKLFDNRTRLSIILEVLCGQEMDGANLVNVKDTVESFIAKPKMDYAAILGAFGAYVHVNHLAAKGYPLVLKVIYDEDWVSEEDILRYYNGDEHESDPGFSAAKSSASPFLKWLQTAPTSDSEDRSD